MPTAEAQPHEYHHLSVLTHIIYYLCMCMYAHNLVEVFKWLKDYETTLGTQ